MQKDYFPVKNFPSLEGFKPQAEVTQKLKVCIATEEIFGPVRNGGIASTYFHLARNLAANGHEVTVLYLKGQQCENETIEHWIDFYQELQVSFVPLPKSDFELVCASERWQRRMYDLYYYLQEHNHFDVVHASEWCGAAYYCLLAKRQGLAFKQTLFIIKSSSPWIWNRHYRMQMVNQTEKVTRMFAERKSIELADIVVGGSAHLLCFMEQKGYTLPPGRTFVQSNVVDLEDLDFANRPNYQYGDIVESEELVFFGRLEGRKGVEVFCDAIDRQIVKQGKLPKKITFMGKQGSRLPTRPHLSPIEFIQERSSHWPIEVKIIDSYDRDKAIGYICSSPKIAVMPSLIENSTMAVYECLVQKIPFIASNAGGTPELVEEEYRSRVLCEAHPETLSIKLEQVLSEGAVVAKGTFDYDNNLTIWQDFHNFLAVELQNKTSLDVLDDIISQASKNNFAPNHARGSIQQANASQATISICIYHYQRPQFLEILLYLLIAQDTDFDEIVLVDDGSNAEEVNNILDKFSQTLGSSRFKVVRTPHLCIGAALNTAASVAKGDLLIFLNAEIHYPKDNFLRVFHKLAKENPSIAAFSCAFDFFGSKYHPNKIEDSKTRVLPLGGDLATAYYMNGCGGSCFMTRKSSFEKIGGFVEAYHIAGIEHEFYARLLLADYKIEFIPESLYWERQIESKIHYNHQSSDYLSILPFLQISPSYMENILLAARALYNEVPKLQKAKSWLQGERTRLQEDKKRLQEDKKRLQEDKKRLQEDKKRLQEENTRLKMILPTKDKALGIKC